MTDRAARKLLSLPLAIGLLTACGQQPAPPPVKPAVAFKNPKAEIDEVDALIAATKQHPSLVNAKDAGPAIHVDPMPKLSGMPGHHMTK